MGRGLVPVTHTVVVDVEELWQATLRAGAQAPVSQDLAQRRRGASAGSTAQSHPGNQPRKR